MIIELTSPMFCILLCVGCGIGWLLWKKYNFQFKFWIIPLFICYALMLIKLTIFPIFIFDKETLAEIKEGAGKYFVFYQIIPFASIKNYFQAETMIQLIGNILLLSPFVVFLEVFSRQRTKAWKVVLIASSASFLIELIQLSINLISGHPSRIADVDDLILNIVGIFFAIAITRLTRKNSTIQTRLQRLLYR